MSTSASTRSTFVYSGWQFSILPSRAAVTIYIMILLWYHTVPTQKGMVSVAFPSKRFEAYKKSSIFLYQHDHRHSPSIFEKKYHLEVPNDRVNFFSNSDEECLWSRDEGILTVVCDDVISNAYIFSLPKYRNPIHNLQICHHEEFWMKLVNDVYKYFKIVDFK